MMEDPRAQLAMMYIDEYLHGKGHTMLSVVQLTVAEAKRLLTEASTYAACKMTEMEDRAKVVEEIHGVSQAE